MTDGIEGEAASAASFTYLGAGGVWYGIALNKGQVFTPPPALAAKCARQPKLFAPVMKKRGRPRKTQDAENDA